MEVLEDLEFNKPLYYLSVPGFALGTISLKFLQVLFLGGSLQLGPTTLMLLLATIGTIMTFTGIFLHSMSGILRQTKPTSLVIG